MCSSDLAVTLHTVDGYKRVIIVGVEDEEIVLHGGKRHESAHGEPGHIDEEPEVANFGDECRIRFGAAGGNLFEQKRVELHILAVAFGISGVPFGGRDVVGGLLERRCGAGLGVEERAVHDQVGAAVHAMMTKAKIPGEAKSRGLAAIGFDDDWIYKEVPKPLAERAIPTQHLPNAEAEAVFAEWLTLPNKKPY